MCLVGVLITSCTPGVEGLPDKPSLHWSDGDSGTINGVDFRLANVDAPETSPIGWKNGARCKQELKLGREAKRFMREVTRSEPVTITKDHGADRYNRRVVELSIDGQSIATLAQNKGYLMPWAHKNGKALQPKPNWCR